MPLPPAGPAGKTPIRFLHQLFTTNWQIPVSVILFSLGLGISGYHFVVRLPWDDSLLNASMILAGMGPVDRINTAGGKFFASFYALYSGAVFIIIWASYLQPAMQHFLHQHHLQMASEEADREQTV